MSHIDTYKGRSNETEYSRPFHLFENFVSVCLELWVLKGLFGEHSGNLRPWRVSWVTVVWLFPPNSLAQWVINVASLRKVGKTPSAQSK